MNHYSVSSSVTPVKVRRWQRIECKEHELPYTMGGAEEVLHLSREHNNANILSLGAHFLSVDEAKRAVGVWLSIDFTHGERHVRRIEKLDHV